MPSDDLPRQSAPFLPLVPTLATPVAGACVGAPAQASAGRSHRSSIELLRLVAALGIVWFHMQAPGARIAYSALSLFLILTAFFAAETAIRGGGTRFWAGRVRRIALPWLAWSVFYLVLDWVRYGGLAPELSLDDPLLLLIGLSIHLWFLPFVLIISGPIRLVARRIQSSRAALGSAVGAVPLALAGFYLQNRVALPAPLAQWAVALPAVCYGVVAALGRRWHGRLVPILFVGAVIAAGLALGTTEGLAQLAIAASAFEIGWGVDLEWWLGIDFSMLGRLSFGIYLIHPFCMLVYFKLFQGGALSIAAVMFVFLLSACCTALLQRLPMAKALV